jgi:hypothetical protein
MIQIYACQVMPRTMTKTPDERTHNTKERNESFWKKRKTWGVAARTKE